LVAIVVPISLSGIDWWDVGAALVLFPLIAFGAGLFVTAAYQRFAPDSLARRHVICSGPACVLWLIVIASAFALDALTPVSEIAFWVWLGASLLIAAARGYGGCEVMAFTNLITGRRGQIGCLIYTPIDAIEERRRARQAPDPVQAHR
jgi:hypothetical protein